MGSRQPQGVKGVNFGGIEFVGIFPIAAGRAVVVQGSLAPEGMPGAVQIVGRGFGVGQGLAMVIERT